MLITKIAVTICRAVVDLTLKIIFTISTFLCFEPLPNEWSGGYDTPFMGYSLYFDTISEQSL